MDNQLKILKSYKQSVFAGNATKEKVDKGEKIITIENNKFSFEPSPGRLLIATIEPQGTENGKEIFHTDKGCPIAISSTEVFLTFIERMKWHLLIIWVTQLLTGRTKQVVV